MDVDDRGPGLEQGKVLICRHTCYRLCGFRRFYCAGRAASVNRILASGWKSVPEFSPILPCGYWISSAIVNNHQVKEAYRKWDKAVGLLPEALKIDPAI
jgi:hypothetical protein